MQDDVYLLVQDGWTAVMEGSPNTDLIPQPLIVSRYFAAEQAAIEQLEVDRDGIARQLEELDEAHGGEDGLLAESVLNIRWSCVSRYLRVKWQGPEGIMLAERALVDAATVVCAPMFPVSVSVRPYRKWKQEAGSGKGLST
jgi:hypothetical protein